MEMNTDQLVEMARDLGAAIQQDERFIRTQMAQAAADEDAALQELIGEFNLKRIAINAETGKEDKDADKLKQLDTELRDVYARIMENEHMAEYNAAKTELDKLVNAIATIITLASQGQNPDEIETGGCSGNCAGCGGCH